MVALFDFFREIHIVILQSAERFVYRTLVLGLMGE
jgi:hypothetical protein